MSLFDLTGDVILLTGAAGGIGRAAAAALRAAGATVIGTDLHDADDVIAHDVTSAEDWRRVSQEIADRHGMLSCLVNNAGIVVTRSLEDTTLATWRQVQAVNVESIVLSLQACLPLLRAAGQSRPGGASVVNMSSAAGRRGAAFHPAYAASKAAVLSLTQTVAAEFAALRYKVRVNSVHPGGVQTRMMAGITADAAQYMGGSAADVLAAMTARHPMGRLGQPDEMAGGIVYLCSPAASFVTGSALAIDGGWTAS